jgi:hypothetical protein
VRSFELPETKLNYWKENPDEERQVCSNGRR